MKIPTDASPALQAALKDLDERLTRLGASTANTANQNLRGARVTNAGQAQAMTDYTTLEQVLAVVRQAITEAEQTWSKERGQLLADIAAAARASTAPAALADVPAWLATVVSNMRA